MASDLGLRGRTAWVRNLAAPLRDFMGNETGGAVVMLAAAVVALLWANSPWPDSYESFWTTRVSLAVGSADVSLDLRHVVNQGLMTFFFLVVGLEAKRELDRGQLRERTRIAIPAAAAVAGIVVPVAIYLAFNAGGDGAAGWGAAMSTDTAFALGVLALLAPNATRLRVALLTFAVVDDLAALLVIATVYTEELSVMPLVIGLVLFGGLLALRWAPPSWRGQAAVVLGVAVWVALLDSGIDPVITGLAVGLITTAYPPGRSDLERVTELARSFREQPTPALARSARLGVDSAVPANDRLQYRLHPWTSFVIVPLFALANVGVHLDGDLLADAVTSPITLGILLGYVVGKPAGIMGGVWLASRPRFGLQPTVSFSVASLGATVAGIGFTVSLLVASLAFNGQELEEAKLGVLGAAVIATALGALVVQVIKRLPESLRARQVAGTRDEILDLSDDIDPGRPHPGRALRPRDAGRVRRLRVPLLRPGRGRGPRARQLVRRRPALRVAPPPAQRRPPARAARRRGRGGGGRAGRVLGDARPAALPPGRARDGRSRRLRRDARARRRAVLARARGASQPRADRARRRERRRERRGGHADVLHQRDAPRGRLRRGDPDRRGPRCAMARADAPRPRAPSRRRTRPSRPATRRR